MAPGGAPDSAPQACHELLVALAGRLPDEILWRLRDWLAAGAHGPIAEMLPRELLRHRVGLGDEEHALLVTAAGGWGAPGRLLDAVLPLDARPAPVPAFGPGADDVDTTALSLVAVVRGHRGCTEIRQTWREGSPAQRVVVVRGGERPWVLAGTLQRLSRAHGDRTPCVEVLPAHGEPPSYHRAAIIGSRLLWRSVVPEAALATA